MRVLMVGAEALPYAKVGGLGDVLGALPKALAAEGADVTLILPKYRQVSAAKHDLERVPVPDGWSVGLHFVNHGFGLLRGTIPGSTATVLFIENTYRPIGICFRSPDGDAAVGGFGGRRQGQ